MSSSIGNGIDYSLLFNATSDPTSNLLGALYGTNSGTGSSPTASLAALQTAETNQTADVAAEAKQPQVASDIAAFTAAVAAAKTPADVLNNPAALKVLLTANGLGSQLAYPGLAQKVLLSNPSDPNSLVNQINSSNSAWLPVVQTLQFASKGLSVLQSPSVLSTLTSGYAEVTWRQSLDAATPGLSNALTFLQNASKIKTADDVLGDATLRTVVTTAFNIPQQIAFQDLGAQESAITSQLDISRLSDPLYVNGIAQQYLLNAAQTSTASPSLDQLAVQGAGLVV